MVDLTRVTTFQWDAGNEPKIATKHGVSRSEAEQVFLNEPLLLDDDVAHSIVELRFQALGRTDEGRMLHITFTLRRSGTHLRIISARNMSRKERARYVEEA